MESKIRDYIEYKAKVKELTKLIKDLEVEIKDSIVGKIQHNWYILTKKEKTTYVLKDDVDMEKISSRYPWICNTIHWIDDSKLDIEVIKEQYPDAYYEKTTVNAKDLYGVAENPNDLVEIKTTEYLNMIASKKKVEEIDF